VSDERKLETKKKSFSFVPKCIPVDLICALILSIQITRNEVTNKDDDDDDGNGNQVAIRSHFFGIPSRTSSNVGFPSNCRPIRDGLIIRLHMAAFFKLPSPVLSCILIEHCIDL